MTNNTAPYVPTYTTMDGVDDLLTLGSVLPLLRLTKGLIVARGAAQVERQIAASWGASTYRHGGLMTGIEHIMYRHGFNSGFSNVSRFAQGTRVRDISNYVDAAFGMDGSRPLVQARTLWKATSAA
jgi:hypothetical protein